MLPLCHLLSWYSSLCPRGPDCHQDAPDVRILARHRLIMAENNNELFKLEWVNTTNVKYKMKRISCINKSSSVKINIKHKTLKCIKCTTIMSHEWLMKNKWQTKILIQFYKNKQIPFIINILHCSCSFQMIWCFQKNRTCLDCYWPYADHNPIWCGLDFFLSLARVWCFKDYV